MSGHQRPTRVLQAVYGLDVGGIEQWLLHVLRAIDRERFEVDVLVLDPECDDYAPQVRELGCRIVPLPLAPALTYPRRFARIVEENGPYDAIHSSLGLHDGVMMWLAARNDIPVRVSHSRNTVYSSAEGPNPRALPRRLAQQTYARLMRHWMLRHATHLLGVSEAAAAALFGDAVVDDPRCMVLPSSIETADFADPTETAGVREELDIPPGARVVAHVGRFVEQKNHEFIVDIAAATIAEDDAVYFMLVGDGPLRPQVEAKVEDLGLEQNFIFTGLRDDVPRLLLGLADVFLLPSRWEGMGRVLIEAQLAGVPCLISDVVPPEVEVVEPLTRRLPLTQGPDEWASELLGLLRDPPPITQQEAFEQIAGTVFNIEVAVQQLERIYGASV